MSVPFFFAPMATLSHRAMRELIEHFGGCDVYFTEMISAGALLSGGQFEKYYEDPLPCPERLVYQLVGADPAQLAAAAARLDGRGAAGIDINMGCSAPEIVRTGAGVRWMADAEAARAMIAGVRSAVKGKLSVKLRLGADEDFERLTAFCRALEEEGVDFFTLHPRTSSEKLKRRARWSFVGALRAELRVPVVGNGDVDTARTLAERAAGPCDGVMVGRAAVRKPWLFAAARCIETGTRTPDERIDLLALAEHFLELLARHQPPEFRETRARRFFLYYCENLLWAHHVRTALNRETELPAMAALLRSHFERNPEERWASAY